MFLNRYEKQVLQFEKRIKRNEWSDLPLGLEDLLPENLEVLVLQMVRLGPKHVNGMTLYIKICTVHP